MITLSNNSISQNDINKNTLVNYNTQDCKPSVQAERLVTKTSPQKNDNKQWKKLAACTGALATAAGIFLAFKHLKKINLNNNTNKTIPDLKNKLKILSEDYGIKKQEIDLSNDDVFYLGSKESSKCLKISDDTNIDFEHLKIHIKDNNVVVFNNSSTQKTFVNEALINSQGHCLQNGDKLYLGKNVYEYNGTKLITNLEDTASRNCGFKNYEDLSKNLQASLQDEAMGHNLDEFLAEQLFAPQNANILENLNNNIHNVVNNAIKTKKANAQLNKAEIDELNYVYKNVTGLTHSHSSDYWNKLYMGKIANCLSKKGLSITNRNYAKHTGDVINTGTRIKNIPDKLYNKAIEEKILFPKGVENIELKQGNTGDCYLVAALYSLCKNKKGSEIIKNMIQVMPDRNYRVTFANNKSAIVRPEEIFAQAGKHTSSGAYGIKVIERAYSKLAKQSRSIKSGLISNRSMYACEGGDTNNVLHNVTGWKRNILNCKGITYTKQPTHIDNTFADEARKTPGIKAKLNLFLTKLAQAPDDYIINCHTTTGGKHNINGHSFMDKTGIFYAQHAYSIPTNNIDVVNKKITIINPHDTRKPQTISWDEFAEYFNEISTVKAP